MRQRFIDFDETDISNVIVRLLVFSSGSFEAIAGGGSDVDFGGEEIVFGEVHRGFLFCTFGSGSGFGLHFGEEVVAGWSFDGQRTNFAFEVERSITFFVALLLNNHDGVALHSYYKYINLLYPNSHPLNPIPFSLS